MPLKTSVISAKLELELKNAFVAIAESKHRPTSQILRDLIRVYVDSNKMPNELTTKTLQQSDKGEDVHNAKNITELFKQLDI